MSQDRSEAQCDSVEDIGKRYIQRNGLFQLLEKQTFTSPYFDFDVKTGCEEKDVEELIKNLTKLSEKWGTYIYGGYSNKKEFEKFGLTYLEKGKKEFSLHAIFLETKILSAQMQGLLKRKTISKISPDLTVYKCDSQQLFRHFFSDKITSEKKRENTACEQVLCSNKERKISIEETYIKTSDVLDKFAEVNVKDLDGIFYEVEAPKIIRTPTEKKLHLKARTDLIKEREILEKSPLKYDDMQKLFKYFAMADEPRINMIHEVYESQEHDEDKISRAISDAKKKVDISQITDSPLQILKSIMKIVDDIPEQKLSKELQIMQDIDDMIIIMKDYVIFIEEENGLYFTNDKFQLLKFSENNKKQLLNVFRNLLTPEQFKILYDDKTFELLKQEFSMTDTIKRSIREFITQDKFYFKNGSYSFKESKFEPYSKENRFIIFSDIDFEQEGNNDSVLNYLKNVLNGDQYEQIMFYIAKICINKQYKELYNFQSFSGNYGKSTLMSLLKQLFQNRMQDLTVAALNQSTEGANETLYNILSNYTLLAYINEPGDMTQQTALAVKQNVNDCNMTKNVRKLYQSNENFLQMYQIVVDSNNSLHDVSRDEAFQSRIRCVQFQNLFVGEEDKQYIEKYQTLTEKDQDEDGLFNIGGKRCKKVMKKEIINFTKKDGIALFHLLIPFIQKILYEGYEFVDIRTSVRGTMKDHFKNWFYDNFEPQKDTYIQLQDLVEVYKRQNSDDKYNTAKLRNDIQLLKDLNIQFIERRQIQGRRMRNLMKGYRIILEKDQEMNYQQK